MIAFTIPGEAVPWARAGSKNGRRFTPDRQRGYMLAVREAAAQAANLPVLGPVEMRVTAVYVRPASMTKKAAASVAGQFKATRPDLSNLVKLVEDAIIGIAYVDDGQIARSIAEKVYGPQAELRVTVVPIAGVKA